MYTYTRTREVVDAHLSDGQLTQIRIHRANTREEKKNIYIYKYL